MDKAEALAYVSRLFDAAQAGAVLWGDKLLLKRFLEQCSRTGSKETQDGYRRELRHFVRWRDRNHPHLHLRELDPALVDDWVSQLREQVAAGELMPRSYNRRISAVSALYRWASEPTRSAVTGVPRNPIPRRTGMSAPKLAKPLAESDLTSVLGVISAAKVKGSAIAARDYVMVRGSYLLGCRVSELCCLQWKEIEPLDDPDRRAGFRKRIKALVAKINDPDIKAEYRAEFDQRIDAQFGRVPQAGFRAEGQRGGYGGRKGGRGFNTLQPPTAELVAQRKRKSPPASARQLLLAVIEYPEIADAEAETLLQMSFGTLDSLRDAILDACFSGEPLPVGGLRDALSRRGFAPQLTRLAVDKAPMRASLGGNEADADSRLEAWRRLSASYMERVAQDTQDRPRHADFFEEGDSDALRNYLVAERRGRQR